MNLWEKYHTSFKENASKTAFYIENRSYSYAGFREYISGSQQLLMKHIGLSSVHSIGVMCHDNIETYAAIFAIWFSGTMNSSKTRDNGWDGVKYSSRYCKQA